MARVMRCDRCGKIYDPYWDKNNCNQVSLGSGYEDGQTPFEAELVCDLCPECLKEVQNFIERTNFIK